MNECFHAKCGERAREAPVCPACKHNNTDVSIHQVDPGKACRDLEKCLSRRHVDRIPLPNPLPYPPPSSSPSLSFLLPTLRGAVSNAISIFPARFIALYLLRAIAVDLGRRLARSIRPAFYRTCAEMRGPSGERVAAIDLTRSHQRNFEAENLEIRENDDRTRLKHSQLLPR